MIAFDESQWPIVAVARDGELTIADATAQIIAFDNMLRRREPFTLLITNEDRGRGIEDGGASETGANGIATRWLAANRELQTWCRAIAIIGPPPLEGQESNDPLTAIVSPLAYFPDDERAEAWLTECLSEASPVTDQTQAPSTASDTDH